MENDKSGSSSVGRALAFQAGGREFESRLPLQTKINKNISAHVAQSVERFLGKEEVHRFDSGRGLQHAICGFIEGGQACLGAVL